MSVPRQVYEKLEPVCELGPVSFYDGVLWLEAQETSDMASDCVDPDKMQAKIFQNSKLQFLTVVNETAGDIKTKFQYLNKSQTDTAGVKFLLVSYKEAECSGNCGVTFTRFPVSFRVDVASKTYLVSCGKSDDIEFKETSVPEKIDGKQKDLVFYREKCGSQKYVRYESVLKPGWFLCTKREGDLHRLALKQPLCIDETILFKNGSDVKK